MRTLVERWRAWYRISAQGVAVLIKDMGSGPNPIEVIPEKDLSTSMSALPRTSFFWNQYPGEGSTEAQDLGFPGTGWIRAEKASDQRVK